MVLVIIYYYISLNCDKIVEKYVKLRACHTEPLTTCKTS